MGLEKELIEANRRLTGARGTEEWRSARQEVLRLERLVADSKNEPHAVPCEFPVKWDVGAPLPILLRNDYHAFLTFYVRVPHPEWDGKTLKVVDPKSTENVPLCLVRFHGCSSAKLGHPNDEAQHGHLLAGRGLEGYSAQIVKNSPWLKEVAKTNSAHPKDHPASWVAKNHYIFWFHDSAFECLAKSYEVEVSFEPMPVLLRRVSEMLLE